MEFGLDTWWLVGIILTAVIGVIAFFLKRTINTQDSHSKDINKIKLTYVTKDELKDVRNTLSDDLKKARCDIEEMKEQMLRKDDYYRLQTQTDSKIDKIYDLILQMKGDNKNAR